MVAQYVKKGRPLLVEGRLKLDTWEDKNTHQKQSKLRVVLESFSFLDSQRSGEGGAVAAPQAARPAVAPASPEVSAPAGPGPRRTVRPSR